ncbi:MAG: Asp-tRNA(Asn)/Glu-tRNA(Gln) amidotransferase subunit GatA [Methylotenera sp.]|uniref:Asp-tRNA(Asn)/Glu-tRNA(Gln) amidotransferase subunit GatA n=1 Tax=Methylotenera sp. TaxID=2051956 RepID=UPI00271D5935|nr:Asp-tRNA(Asn)/Glu-tRNA(Gln) amidotransferase subunit GatA [Methylotenera sp.]MDO9205423.1 Asp-tRNA(Asn)/Glu-tRNA(Gln) amidotransferase subunit GatA [Methylotenera sp.]MDO9392373.1 Asp-tRNA(Asn)/Glu-tRNA(Gln) amidotransferase subunit GatA [Methylotenera sp.]MDP1523424.1 Asp-tRNA(Asn)/Glu-tRNA(Gln) amidotransferase subunit GatA [Methylotenera sp.]MDP3307965.1 Asp-tRNA(Asn)/Glu-tRNA(Gln) amidotransferase subunit GatA [Methylotenera sp.]MDP3817687.1 Asp-tRNA(Asn)/Glu-tRNA(Gln) amidotransferase 
MINSSLKQLGDLLQAKKISSVELTQTFLSRISQYNPSINAYIALDEAKTLNQAKAADARIASGNATALTGIPIAQKDIFCAKGWQTTCGSKMLANFIAPYDAHVITQFDAAGAVNLGKTNMDEFAMGSSNETSYFGGVKNPWSFDRVPGGSSGGSAAAVAARLCAAATGTDTGGSIRQPASLCGFTGLKPTYGVVSRYGMIAFASSLDQAGPMAKSAEDCALMMNVMAGFDERDSTSLNREKEDYTRDLNKPNLDLPLKGLKVGLPKEFFADGLDASVGKVIDSAIAEYKKLGAEIVEISLPNTGLSIPVYYVLAPAEASSNLSRYDGVRYGHRAAEYTDLMDMYNKSRAEGFGAEVKRRILIGTYVLSAGYYDAYYLKAQQIRRLIAQDFVEAFKQCDVIMGPAAPSTAFKAGEKVDDPVAMYLQDIYTISTNLAGLPGMSVPAGFAQSDDGKQLPVGLQIIGNYFDEARMLNVAHQYQQVTDWHNRMPDLDMSEGSV